MRKCYQLSAAHHCLSPPRWLLLLDVPQTSFGFHHVFAGRDRHGRCDRIACIPSQFRLENGKFAWQCRLDGGTAMTAAAAALPVLTAGGGSGRASGGGSPSRSGRSTTGRRC
jgi:hypothetical protein